MYMATIGQAGMQFFDLNQIITRKAPCAFCFGAIDRANTSSISAPAADTVFRLAEASLIADLSSLQAQAPTRKAL
jgi:hypothetical protein